MPARKQDQKPRSHAKSAAGAGPRTTGKDRPASKALPKAAKRPDTGQPGGGQGRVDITGTIPQGIRIDPDITEGHPGYQERGESEIIPAKRSAGGKATGRATGRKGSRG